MVCTERRNEFRAMTTALRFLYSSLLFLAVPLILLRLFWRGIRQRGYWQHIGERFGLFSGEHPGRCLWIHAVSVGEMRAAQPLVKRFRTSYPDRQILISCMTATGREVANELYTGQAECVYLPYDLFLLQRRLIRYFRPSILLIMETEIWPNLLAASRREQVPALLVNARLSEKSRRGYARFAPIHALTREALQSLNKIAAQSSADAERLASLGAQAIAVSGNIKFDVPVDPVLIARGQAWRDTFATGKRVLLAASTREGEESLLLDAYRRKFSPAERDRILLVVVPRHPQRFDAVFQQIQTAGFRVGKRSTGEATDNFDVWFGDSMGEMAAYFSMCDVAFIGGSLLPLGGQNLIEACVQGKPVIMGPSVYNFADAARLAVDAGAMRQGENADAVMRFAREWLQNEKVRESASRAALAFASAHAGATEKTMALISPLLAPLPDR